MTVEPPKSLVRENADQQEDPRALAGRVVHAIYRLIKGCFLHDDSNHAITNLIEFVVESTHLFCDRAGVEAASVLFAGNSVFVNRQMLRASRETYQLALELGTLLAGCNITEVTLERGVLPAHIGEFGRAVALMHREKTPSPKMADGGWPGLKVRRVVGFGGAEVLSPVTRVARTYAASIMIVRAFYSDLKKGKFELSHSVKRVAQKLAGIPEDERRLLLSTAAAPSTDTDRAGLIVSSAIVAVVMASQLTDDRSALTSLATAAILYDAGRTRMTHGNGTDGPTIERVLNEDEEERLPTASIVALTALGKLHPPAVTRSVIVYEALALRNEATTPYGGARQPHVLSRILSIARAFTEMRVSRGTSPALSVDDAIQVLTGQAKDNTERTFVKLLVGTLGVFPAGTLVELNTGELAVVVSTPRLPVDFARPPVRIMYDAQGAVLEEPIDIDLASPQRIEGAPVRLIAKPIDASDQQMKQMRSYVMSLSAKRRKSSDKNRANKAPAAPPPKVTERPAARRRLSAPQAAIPEALRRLEEQGAQTEPIHDVEILSADEESAPISLGDAALEAAVLPRPGPPGPPPKRGESDEERARRERANADPEVSFESIDLQPGNSSSAASLNAPLGPLPSARAATSGSAASATPIASRPVASPAPPVALQSPASVASPSAMGPASTLRPERAQPRRWDPRSEDEPPPEDESASAAPSFELAEAEPASVRQAVEKSPAPVAALAKSGPRVPPPRPAAPVAASATATPIAIPIVSSFATATPSATVTPLATASATATPALGVSAQAVPGKPRPHTKPPLIPKTTTEILIPIPEEAVPSERSPAGSTREVNWSQYGKEIVEAVGVPEPSQSETDAILAAYLSEEARAPVSEPPEMMGGRSAGLRWDATSSMGQAVGSPPSTAGHSTGGHSTGGHATGSVSTGGHSTGDHSTGGATGHGQHNVRASVARATNSGGLRWEGRSSSGRDQGSSQGGESPSSPETDFSSAEMGWESAPPDRSATGMERGTPVSQQGRDSAAGNTPSRQGNDPTSQSLRGRAKAGSQGWGNPRRDKSK